MDISNNSWVKEFPAAITISDAEGNILEMNNKAAEVFEADGGRVLIGSNVLDCHPEAARNKLTSLMESRKTNVYTIEKNGIKKLIYQAPWYKNKSYAGYIEITFEIPFDLPHFIRE